MFAFPEPEKSTGLQLWAAHHQWQNSIKRVLSPFKLTHTQFVILTTLFWLEQNGSEVSQSIITRITSIDKMTISKAVKGLVARNAVSQNTKSIDSRVNLLTITSKGSELCLAALREVECADKRFFSALAPDEQAKLSQLLHALRESV